MGVTSCHGPTAPPARGPGDRDPQAEADQLLADAGDRAGRGSRAPRRRPRSPRSAPWRTRRPTRWWRSTAVGSPQDCASASASTAATASPAGVRQPARLPGETAGSRNPRAGVGASAAGTTTVAVARRAGPAVAGPRRGSSISRPDGTAGHRVGSSGGGGGGTVGSQRERRVGRAHRRWPSRGGRVLGQHPHHQVAHRPAARRPAAAAAASWHVGHRDAHRRVAVERPAPGEALVGHDAERVDVAGRRDADRPAPAPARGSARCR